ncbi:lipoprotein [Stenotrophomonas sp. MMGLT7]|uniref:LPS translocon maturation chaperone LptM n=1 Tax=Stenotrophomonas sp. MMGLT7 TaxID=2901227 RepID=UPI001E399ACB|nr:lipoprotein [Stenotrophomonas sp. MMGLT7]MCD7098336.1 lipoprotein [Stenotrophomonas sp. MMGLT7]
MTIKLSPKIRIALAGAALLALAACGNKGPLVMPQKPVPVDTAPATPAADIPPADQLQPEDGRAEPVQDNGDDE